MDRREMLKGAVAAAAGYGAATDESKRLELREAQYVMVELLGYKKLCGRLSQGFGGLLQLDVPAEGGFVTQFINPASVYRITIISAAAVKQMAKNIDPLPTIELEVRPYQPRLPYEDDPREF